MDISSFLAFLAEAPLWADAIVAVLVALAGLAALTKWEKDDEFVAKLLKPAKAVADFLRNLRKPKP